MCSDTEELFLLSSLRLGTFFGLAWGDKLEARDSEPMQTRRSAFGDIGTFKVVTPKPLDNSQVL
jgi:hypothetical protein